MVLRGSFGDTRVDPVVLFDVHDLEGAGPPADAIDVQFRAPLTFSLLVDALVRNDRELDAQTCLTVYEKVIEHTVGKVQVACGYVTDDGSVSSPARLELATLGESSVPGLDTVRMHHHLWIGPTAETLDDGVRRTVDRRRLRDALRNVVWPSYLGRLRELTELTCGISWGIPWPGAAGQIVDPPLHEHLAGHELGVCPSPWGAREMWEQPTEKWLADVAEDERAAAGDAERGLLYWTPPGTERS